MTRVIDLWVGILVPEYLSLLRLYLYTCRLWEVNHLLIWFVKIKIWSASPTNTLYTGNEQILKAGLYNKQNKCYFGWIFRTIESLKKSIYKYAKSVKKTVSFFLFHSEYAKVKHLSESTTVTHYIDSFNISKTSIPFLRKPFVGTNISQKSFFLCFIDFFEMYLKWERWNSIFLGCVLQAYCTGLHIFRWNCEYILYARSQLLIFIDLNFVFKIKKITTRL